MYSQTVFLGMGLYEIFLTLGILVVFFLADRMAVKSGFSVTLQRVLIIGFLTAICFGFLGAVLFQAFYNFMETGVFVIDNGTGMTFYGGFLFGAAAFLAVWFLGGRFCQEKTEPRRRFHEIANIAACMLPLAHAFGRIGCLFAGCCHGKPTNAWYGITMHTENGWQKVVPVQLFEAIFLFALAAVLFWLYFRQKKTPMGKLEKLPLLGGYGALYGVWRFFIEFARGDDRGETVISFLSPSQLIALLLTVAGAAYILFKTLGKTRTDESTKQEKIK